MLIKTAKSKEFEVAWAGVATFDGIFRIEIMKPDNLSEVFSVFNDISETVRLSYIVDSVVTVFNGYKVFRGVSVEPNGNVTVSLAKE